MKKIAQITIVLILTTAGLAAQQTAKPTGMTTDETAIRANVAQMVTGWNTKNGADYARPFAVDADYVVINGVHIKGRAANGAAHQRIFGGYHKTSILTSTVEQIRFLRVDVALVHVLGAIKFLGQPERDGSARITLVMTKNKGLWEIEAFQNTQIQETGPAGGK